MTESQVIIVRVPPERVAWLLRELSSANFPFDTRPDPETGGLAVRAPAGAQSIFQQVLGYKRKRRWRLSWKWLMLLLGIVLIGVVIYVTGFDLWVADLFSSRPSEVPAAAVLDPVASATDAVIDGVTSAVQWGMSVVVGAVVIALMFALVLFGRRK